MMIANHRYRSQIVWGILTMTALCLAMASVGGLLDIPISSIRFYRWAAWAAELSSNFRPQYLVILSLLAIVFWVGRRTKRVLFVSIFAALNLLLILPLYASSQPEAVSQNYRLLLFNAGQIKKSEHSVLDLIDTTEPDLIVLLEVAPEAQLDYEPLHGKYRYMTYQTGHEEYDGSLVYSKFPFDVAAIGPEFGQDHASLVTQVKLGTQTLNLITTQTRAPMHPARTINRHLQIEQLGQFVALQQGSIMLLGDLNTANWSPIFRELLDQSGLNDGRKGFGLQGSWPTFIPSFLAVPIDHVLVSADIHIQNFSRGPRVGSDHYPLLVDFSFSPERSPNSIDGENGFQ